MPINYKTTKEIKVSEKIVDQIIGQDEAVNIIKKASKQRRHVLLIGEPGTGKSMISQALAELLPKEKLVDFLSIDNPADENSPIIKTVPRGQGKQIVEKSKLQFKSSLKNQNLIFFFLLIISMITPWWIRKEYGDIMAAASLIGSMIFLGMFILFMNLNKRIRTGNKIPKLLIDNSDKKTAPFLEATGAHAGALLGDILHDPLQSLYSSNKILIATTNSTTYEQQRINFINNLLKKHKKELIKQGTYTASFLNKNELKILAEKNNKIEPAGVLSINKYKSDKPYLIKLKTESGKTITVTPEHKIAVNKKGKIEYIEAQKLKNKDEVTTLSN